MKPIKANTETKCMEESLRSKLSLCISSVCIYLERIVTESDRLKVLFIRERTE